MATESPRNCADGKDSSADEGEEEKFTFFWKKQPLSPHHPSRFKVEDVVYDCVIQFWMHKNACE